MKDVTQLLEAVNRGEQQATDELLAAVYGELRNLATRKLARERPGQTLQATALVHEAYVRLVDTEKAQHWNSRGHFFGAAAEAMRRILVDRAREKSAEKCGGGLQRVELDSDVACDGEPDAILEISEALAELEACNVEAAKLVKLRYFAGFSHTEAAEVMGISRRAADRLWTLARTWLYRQISRS